MNRTILIFLLTVLLAASVESSPRRFVGGLSAEEKRQAEQIPVSSSSLPDDGYQVLGPVEGQSCQATYDDIYTASEADAVQELKRATLKKGGDAVMESSCQAYGANEAGDGCFRSYVCRGIAVRKQP